MDNLKDWIEPLLDERGCRLYEIEWLSNENPPLLRIAIEKTGGTVDLDICAACSDTIGALLDEKDWYGHEYNLEVCSPGAERELKTDEEIQNAMGKYVYIKLKDPKQGLSRMRGYLKKVEPDCVTVSYKEKTRDKTIVIEKSNLALIMTTVKV